MKDRYQLICAAYQRQMGYPAHKPVAVRGKVKELAGFVLLAIETGGDWWVKDMKNPDTVVPREIVLSQCGIPNA